MKQAIYLTLLLIAIPFFVVIFTFSDIQQPKDVEQEKTTSVIVRVKREATSQVESVPLEDYVTGVVAGEMPIKFHIEALKAQAVAARSYVLSRLDKSKNDEYDVVDGVTNQVYLDDNQLKEKWKDNYSENILKLKQAVSETKLQYIEYGGKVADALFFSTSNGYTENSEEIFSVETPYLRSVDSAWDKDTSPVFNDQKTFNADQFFSLLGIDKADNLTVDVLKKSSTGRSLVVKIDGVEMKGSDVASKLGLRSNDFEIKMDGNTVTVKTSGYGHGVGMSQYGALGMANAGYTYDEILKHYYQGVDIATLSK